MRPIRRALAFVLNLLLLQLSVLGGGAACTRLDGMNGATGASARRDVHSGAHGSQHGGQHVSETAPAAHAAHTANAERPGSGPAAAAAVASTGEQPASGSPGDVQHRPTFAAKS